MKCGSAQVGAALGTLSLPVRGAWVEIPLYSTSAEFPSSLPVRGAWVEICATNFVRRSVGRSPCGERGLKL